MFKTTNVGNGTFGTTKAVFPVDSTHLPLGFTNNPVYSQPLYVSQLFVNGAYNNFLYVAALNGEVYAYHADNLASPTTLWKRDDSLTGLGGLKHNCDSVSGGGSSVSNPVPYVDFAGILSTPTIAIIPGSAVMYVVNLCKNAPPDNSEHWWLNALNIGTGAHMAGSPVELKYTSTDINNNLYGPHHAFAANLQFQRASLMFVPGAVNTTNYYSLLVGFGTGTFEGGQFAAQYQGWMFSYNVDPSSPSYLTPDYNQNGSGYNAYALPYVTQCEYPAEVGAGGTPTCSPNMPLGSSGPGRTNSCGDGGGIWRTPAASRISQVFFAAGNGGFNFCPGCTVTCAGNPGGQGTTWHYFTDFGEAVLKADMQGVWSTQPGATSPTQAPFWPTDYFVPFSFPPGQTDPMTCGPQHNQPCPWFGALNTNDYDLGISGNQLFDDNYYDSSTGQTVNGVSMLLTASKFGEGYVLLQSNLGQYQSPNTAVAEFTLSPACTGLPECNEPRSLAHWNPNGLSGGGVLVAWPWQQNPESFQWQQPTSTSQYNYASITTAGNPFSSLPNGAVAGYAGGALALTVNFASGTSTGVMWAEVAPYPNPYNASCPDGRQCPGFLMAYSLQGSSGVLSSSPIWPASLPTTSTQPDFEVSPYTIPTLVNGKAYVPTYAIYNAGTGHYDVSGVQVYGF